MTITHFCSTSNETDPYPIMKKSFQTSHSALFRVLSLAGAVWILAASGPLFADWTRTTGGTYSYTSSLNWSDGPNGTFAAQLTGNQIVTFNANRNVGQGASTPRFMFTYTTPFNMTLQSDNENLVRTLTYGSTSNGGRVWVGDATAARTVTFADTLILNWGTYSAAARLIHAGENTDLVIHSKMTTGHVNGWIHVTTATNGTGTVTLTHSESDFLSGLSLGIVRNLRIASVANAGQASAIGAGSVIRFDNGSSNTTLEYIGSNGSTDRTISLQGHGETGIMSIVNSGTGTLAFTGDFVREGSNATADARLVFSGNSNISVSGNIGDSDGVAGLRVTKLGATSVLTLTGDNHFSGGMHVSQGEVEFTSVGNEGQNSSLGSGGVIQIGASSNKGTLRYVGSTEAITNRELVLDGNAEILNEGTGALVFTGAFTVLDTAAITRSLVLGGTHTGANQIYGNIVDGSATRSLVKQGAGTWILSGNNAYSGGTSIEDGVLEAASQQALAGGDVAIGGSAEATLLVGTGVNLTVDTLILANNAHLGFKLNDQFSSTLITAYEQQGTGVYTVDIFDAGGFSEGTYLLMSVVNASDAEYFQIGQMVAGYSGLLNWDGGSLTLDVSVIPEPDTVFAVMAGALLVMIRIRRSRIKGSL